VSVATPLVAPFPWFGGKRTVAELVWSRLGTVKNYVEPFFGSGAVLLARPDEPRTETVNDADHFLVNFWRSVQAAPEDVARHADWIVAEADLQARHYWLLTEGADRIKACAGDPAHYDAQVAGWWLWGACAWIGSGWCAGDGPWSWDGDKWQGRQLPHMSAGRGINRQLPHMSAGMGIFILNWLNEISARLRNVRVACGDWSRVCGDSVTWRHGMTGVFLDPPYGVEDRATVYSHDSRGVAEQARAWAIEAGKRADMRIAFAGYDTEHDFPGWASVAWKASGGYGSQGDGQGRKNSGREMLWFSPACVSPNQADLFSAGLVGRAK